MRSAFLTLFILLLFIALLVTGSCTVEKRVHRKGLHVEWLSRKKTSTHAVERHAPSPAIAKLPQPGNIPDGKPVCREELRQTPDRYAVAAKEEPCDVMILRNGEEWRVKVSEVTEKEIVYTDCETGSNTSQRIAKSKVFMIKYTNGLKEVMDGTVEEDKPTPPHTSKEEYRSPQGTQVPGSLSGSLLLTIISVLTVAFGVGFLLAIPAFVLAIRALKKINQEPMRYKGSGVAIFCLVVSGGILVILLFLLFVLLAYATGGFNF